MHPDLKKEAAERKFYGEKLLRSVSKLTAKGELWETKIAGLSLYKRTAPTEPLVGAYEPSICLVVQGAKHVWLGEDLYRYDSEHYLFVGLHLPVVSQVVEASPTKPYLGVKLKFHYPEVAELIAESEANLPKAGKKPVQTTRSLAVSRLTIPLLDAFERLIRLLETERDLSLLAPMIEKEIFLRLLQGEQGLLLRQLILNNRLGQNIAEAVFWLKENFAEPLQVEELAKIARMAPSTFHHHFRTMTATSPLQYQKQLRLQEARRLMLSEHLDAASAAYAVGYESPSQFSREYARQYGASPMRDIAALRTKSELLTTA